MSALNPYEAPQEELLASEVHPHTSLWLFWVMLGLQGLCLLGTLVCVLVSLQNLFTQKGRLFVTIGILSLAGATIVGIIVLVLAHRYSLKRWATFEFFLLILLTVLLLLSMN